MLRWLGDQVIIFLHWLASFLPCPHTIIEVVNLDSICGKFHKLKCLGCGKELECDCDMCREPWRDW